MPKSARMCLNLPEWLFFYFPIVIPCLLGRVALKHKKPTSKLQTLWVFLYPDETDNPKLLS